MLSFEDQAIFTCKKRSSPRPLKCTNVVDLSSLLSEACGETVPGSGIPPVCDRYSMEPVRPIALWPASAGKSASHK